jgi:hypothetical protein
LEATIMDSSKLGNNSLEEDEEEEDTIAPLHVCTCGQFTPNDDSSKSPKTGMTRKKTPTWLESSFVHLMAPRRPQQNKQQTHHHHHHCQAQHGFLEQHQHILQLFDAATWSSHQTSSLCADCTDRVAAALEADTQRLYAEVHAYQETVTDAKHRAKTVEAISKVDLGGTERAYQSEIAMLEQELEARETELVHLNVLYKEQLNITEQLDTFEEQAQQEQNALELQSKAFDDSVQLLSNTLSKVQIEVDQLSMVKLPQSLFDLQVDERGLRYPLINQLRLAYRPKGDVPVKEIQVAWSQATQLLLILGTLLKYPSSDWKLVPLADCAKLIYRKEIYNLSPGDCRSLMAWNALLDQVVKYASTFSSSSQKKKSSRLPPFSSSPNSIGNAELTQLDRMDHVGWSQVIHRMASNLLWLSERASELVALQVSTIAHSIV